MKSELTLFSLSLYTERGNENKFENESESDENESENDAGFYSRANAIRTDCEAMGGNWIHFRALFFFCIRGKPLHAWEA